LLQPKVEEADLVAFLDDAHHDTSQRQATIDELALPSGRMHSIFENEAVAKSLVLLDSSLGGAAQPTLKPPSRLMRQLGHQSLVASRALTEALSTTDLKSASDRYDEPVEIRASLQQIIAYILDYGGCHLQSLSAADASVVRAEVVERVNHHHTIAFARFKTRTVMTGPF
jgi:hypothetical protein